MKEDLEYLLRRGHKYEDLLVEINWRVRHRYNNEQHALRSMAWDEKHDWGFTYLSKRPQSAQERYSERICYGRM